MRPPLDGIRILELTIYQNGPWGGVMLSDMGASVIKIEDTVNGDPGRNTSLVPAGRGINAYFETMNRNKRGITLDLKKPEGREVFYTLAKKSDVVIQNFRHGVVQKLGVDYETVKKLNSRIIYASVSGLGDQGPDAREAVLDPLGLARGGLMYHTCMEGEEIFGRTQGALADQTGAITLAYGVLLAIIARERDGVGQHVQVSQLGGQMILQALAINTYLMSGTMARARPRKQVTNPLLTTYPCGDGKWVALSCAQSDRFWPDVCNALGVNELRDDERFRGAAARAKNSAELVDGLQAAFAAHTRDEWIPILKRHGIFCAPVQSYADLPNDPQIQANNYLTTVQHPTLGTLRQVGIPIKLSETPGEVRGPAPEWGQHTEEVLLEHGYTWEQIAGLREKGAI